MAKEIERKFLVINDTYKIGASSQTYKQGYLCTDANRTVRIRIAGEKGFITIKGRTTGFSRDEYEYEIPAEDSHRLLDLCAGFPIEKVRYRSPGPDGKIWEVDVFLGENKGLIIAEIELQDEKENFVLPKWIGREVTGDIHYYNAYLMQHPYSHWKQDLEKP